MSNKNLCIRRSHDLKRKQKKRPRHDRILIVSEGSKTEPFYFEEIRVSRRLNTAHIQVLPCQIGTSPKQVVEYAYDLFKNGNLRKKIGPLAFEQVFTVFDRDAHKTYFDTLKLIDSLDNKEKHIK